MRRRCRRVPALRSSFAGFRFPPDVITLAVRWYLRYGLSYRDVEELLAERGIKVDHVAATTNSALTKQRPCGWRPPSTSWPWRSDQPRINGLACLGFAKRNKAILGAS
jgi:transposase-like protein